MFDRVLVAMDLTPASEALVSILPELKDFGTGELHLVHVARPVAYPVSASISALDGIRERLGNLQRTLEGKGFEVQVTVTTGAPAVKLCELAEERGVDAILIGSRSRNRVQEAFVGSVAWEVVRRTKTPVLLQRIEPSRPDPESALEVRGSGLPNRILHPTDFSDLAERAFHWVEGMVDAGVKEVTLLHVHPVGDDVARSEARILLEARAERLKRRGATEVEVKIRGGDPAEEILLSGATNPDHIVIMGTHGRGFLPEIVLGSESRQVVRRAVARVLLIPSARSSV
ncbi:MAG: universal stress protein [Gemmatimonadales bacterium]|nr:MAG: universal stress protein [Gemmatimonadales bacterium]